MAQRLILGLLVGLATLIQLSVVSADEDKSATRSGLIQLPSPGGTVTAEAGSLDVDPNHGMFSFSLPFPALPSRAGFAPRITLQYSQSAGDDGGFGVGWRLSVPSIEIDPIDGAPRGELLPSGALADHLVLGGERLVFDHIEASNPVYHLTASTKDVLITYHETPFFIGYARGGGDRKPGISAGFEVSYPDGKRELYSADPTVAEGDDGIVTRYPLVFEVAPTGESIAYQYVKVANRTYLRDVIFAGGKSRYTLDLADANGRVTFARGQLQENTKVYTRLSASFDGDLYTQWCFAYSAPIYQPQFARQSLTHEACSKFASADLEQQSARFLDVTTKLASIYRFGTDKMLTPQSARQPNIHFSYSEWSPEPEMVFRAPELLHESFLDPGTFELADVDFDSIADVIERSQNGGTQIFRGTGKLDKLFEDPVPWILKRGGASVAPDLGSDRFIFAGLSSNSFADLLEMQNGKIFSFRGGRGGFAWDGKADQFNSPAAQFIQPATFAAGAGQFASLAGSGYSDLLTTAPDAFGEQGFLVLRNDGQSASGNPQFTEARYPLPLKINEPDLLSRADVKVVDMNGDDLPDLVVLARPGSGLCIYPNIGKLNRAQPGSSALFGLPEGDPACAGGGRFLELPGLPRKESLKGLWFVDVNGDGIMDVAALGEHFNELRVWINRGDFRTVVGPIVLALNSPIYVDAQDTSRTRVADLDGHGQSQIIVFQNAPERDDRALVVDFHRKAGRKLIKPNLLTTIAYESGIRYDLRYATTSDETIRDKRVGVADWSALQFPVVVLKELLETEQRSTGIAQTKLIHYYYHEPIFDPVKRQFGGFGRVEQLTESTPLGDALGQPPLLAETTYYNATETPEESYLLGQAKIQRYFALREPDALTRLVSQVATHGSDEAWHSLIAETQVEELPARAALFQENSYHWQAVARSTNGGAFYIRQTLAVKVVFHQTGDPLQDAKATTKYEDYDTHNHARSITVSDCGLAGPFDINIPHTVKVTLREYLEPPKQAEGPRILDLLNRERQFVDDQPLSDVSYSYKSNGLLAEWSEKVLSALAAAPLPLSGLWSKESIRIIRYDYDRFGNPTRVSDDFGPIEEVQYDNDGILPVLDIRPLPKERSGDGLVTELGYGEGITSGRLSHFRTSLGLRCSLAYDTLGRRTSVRCGDSSEIAFFYRQGLNGLPLLALTAARKHGEGAVDESGDTNGPWVLTLQAYRADGRPLAALENSEKGGVRVTKFSSYNLDNLETRRWLPYEFTAPAPPSSHVQSADARLTTICSAGKSRPVGVCDVFMAGDFPEPATFAGDEFTYDPTGRLAASKYASGKTESVQYESWGSLTRTVYDDRLSGVVARDHFSIGGAAGVLGIVERPSNGGEAPEITRFWRDGAGRLTALRLPGEKEQRFFLYNSAGMLEFEHVPGIGSRYQVYDARGRMVALLRQGEQGEQHSVRWEYDLVDRVTDITADGKRSAELHYDDYRTPWPQGPPADFVAPLDAPLGKLTETVSYDENGFLNTERQFGYDLKGQVVREDAMLGKDRYWVSDAYSLDGALLRQANSFGLRSYFRKGVSDRLQQVDLDLGGGARQTAIEEVTYDAQGDPARISFREGLATEISYDPRTLLLHSIKTKKDQTGSPLLLQNIELDLNGNASIDRITDGLGDSDYGHVRRSGTFKYDWKDQLVSSSKPAYAGAAKFAYDPDGALALNSDFDPLPVTLRAPAVETLPRSSSLQPYHFDGFGQLQSSPRILHASFNALGELIKTETVSSIITYGYDAAGNRSYIRYEPKGGGGSATTTRFPITGIFEEGGHRFSLVYMSGLPSILIDHDKGHWFYYLKNEIGSSDTLVTEDGLPVEQLLYTAYGSGVDARSLSKDWAKHVVDHAAELPSAGPVRQRFVGKDTDATTGLVYFGARYYDPQLSRFISPDPAILNVPEACVERYRECNPYGYAQNNPVKLTDRNGEFAHIVIGAGIGAAAGLAIEGTRQYFAGEYNPRGLVAAAVGGAAAGAVAAATGGASLVAGFGSSVASSVAGGAATRLVLGEQLTAKSVITDAAVGGATFGLVRGFGALTGKLRPGGLGTELGGELDPTGGPTLGRAADEAGALADINPLGGTQNCVNCAAQTDAMLRGQPYGPAASSGPQPISNLGTGWEPVSGPMQIGSILSQSGPGSTGIVFGESLTGDVGHVWNAINNGEGGINFLDGQTGGSGLGNFDNSQNFQFLRTGP